MSKVNLAIIDKDLKIRALKKFPLSASGQQIQVINGGEGHFMPVISNTSYLEFPYRAITSPWKVSFKRIYFSMNKAKACVDFASGDVPLPSLEQLKRALAAASLDKLGKQEPPFPTWIIYLILLTVLGIAANVFGVI